MKWIFIPWCFNSPRFLRFPAWSLFLATLIAFFFTTRKAEAADSINSDKKERAAKQLGIDDAAKSLDRIEKSVSEWGHASLSGLILVPNRGRFDLDYSLPTSNYIAAIRTNINGQAAFFQQTELAGELRARAANSGPAQSTSKANQAELDQQSQISKLVNDIKIAQLQKELERVTNGDLGWQTNLLQLPTNSLSPPSSNTTIVLPAFSNSLPPSPITNGFSPFASLLGAPSSTALSESSILKQGATAKETERVLAFLANPVDIPENKRVLFGIAQVSVMPGWRTKKDYICEVSAHFTYGIERRELQQRLVNDYSTVSNQLHTATNRYNILETNAIYSRKVLMEKPFTNAPGLKPSSFGPELEAFRELEAKRARLTQTISEFELSKVHHVRTIDSLKQRLRTLETNALFQETNQVDGTMTYPNDPAIPKNWGNTSVSVVSAFPFTEAQNMDTQSSIRSQVSMLMNLAGTYLQAGYKIDAEVLLRFTRQIQKDFATRVSLPTVVPGVNPDTLTYRFDPETVAMVDPSKKKPQSGNQLYPTTIPILVLILVEDKDYERYSNLAIEISTRWVPRNYRPFLQKMLVDWPIYNRTRDKVMRQTSLLDLAKEWDNAKIVFDGLKSTTNSDSQSGRELQRRLNISRAIAFGNTALSQLPGKGPIFHGSRQLNTSPTTISIFGENLKSASSDNLPTVLIDGKVAQVYSNSTRDNVIVQPDEDFESGQHTVSLQTGDGRIVVTNGIAFVNKTQCENRPPITITKIYPERGFINQNTIFTIQGTHFSAKTFLDPVTSVTIGGRLAKKVEVLGENIIRCEIPPWDNKDKSPYPNSFNRADLIVSSSCQASILDKCVYFDIVGPGDGSGAGGGAARDAETEKLLKLVEAAKNMNATTAISASIKLEVGNQPNSSSKGATVINVQQGDGNKSGNQ